MFAYTPNRLTENIVFITLFAFFAIPAYGASLLFNIEGQPHKTLTSEDIKALTSRESMAVDNPSNSEVRTYEGVPLNALLTTVYGDVWTGYDEVTFTSVDGYQPAIPIAVINRYKALVAYKEQGHEGCIPIKRKNGMVVNPGPFYLVWNNIEERASRADPTISWPWQLIAIDLSHFTKKYPNATPPADSEAEVQLGFVAFKQHCIKCHSVNGDGSDVGPELNYPVSVTEYWYPEWLVKFISDPQSVRHKSKMIAFYRDVKDREEQIARIIQYLQVMVSHKRKPKSE